MLRHKVLSILVIGLTGCGTTPSRTSSQAGTPADLTAIVGAEVTIRLPSNPTTGYSWRMAGEAPAFLEPVSDEYVPDATQADRLGAGGVQVFVFRAVAAGRADLKFVYVRPWEKDQPPIETRCVRVSVK